MNDIASWRRELHAHPELGFEEKWTSAFLADKLGSFGLQVIQGLGKTGLVASLDGTRPGPRVGLRADMDALPVMEATGLPHASLNPGRMHACGHDGHMALLLGAARELSLKPDFPGTVRFVFQPAEEGGAGARSMIEDGLLARFPCDAMFGLHNWPSLPAGSVGIPPGPALAASDSFELAVIGKGSHGAMPHQGKDPVLAAAHLILGLQSIASRETDPLETVVVTVAHVHGGEAGNVIPDRVLLKGTCRTFSDEVRRNVRASVKRISQGVSLALGVSVETTFTEGYPATVNTRAEAELAGRAAEAVFGAGKVFMNQKPTMGSEDFSYYLEKVPGCYIFLGAGGGPSAGLLHSSTLDFNDNVIPQGVAYWTTLARRYLERG